MKTENHPKSKLLRLSQWLAACRDLAMQQEWIIDPSMPDWRRWYLAGKTPEQAVKLLWRKVRRARRPSPFQQAASVKRWNDANLVGQAVEVRRDDGSILQTETVSEAWLLGGHSAVIKVRGISGAYSLARVTAKRTKQPAPV